MWRAHYTGILKFERCLPLFLPSRTKRPLSTWIGSPASTLRILTVPRWKDMTATVCICLMSPSKPRFGFLLSLMSTDFVDTETLLVRGYSQSDVEALPLNCMLSCGLCEFTCGDSATFTDMWGYDCSTWVGYDCTNTSSGGYSLEDMVAIQNNCPLSCALCEMAHITSTYFRLTFFLSSNSPFPSSRLLAKILWTTQIHKGTTAHLGANRTAMIWRPC